MDEGFFLYWEDADFCRRLEEAGWRTVYLPEARATHVGGRSSRHAADASLEAFHRSAFRLYLEACEPARPAAGTARVRRAAPPPRPDEADRQAHAGVTDTTQRAA